MTQTEENLDNYYEERKYVNVIGVSYSSVVSILNYHFCMKMFTAFTLKEFLALVCRNQNEF